MSERFGFPVGDDDAGVEPQGEGLGFMGEFGERETGDTSFMGEFGEREREGRRNTSRETDEDVPPLG